MITPADYPIQIYRGTDFKLTFTIKNKSTKLPIDLTTYTFDSEVRVDRERVYQDVDLNDISLICTPSITSPTPTLGTIQIYIASSVTAVIEQDSGYWDFIVTDNTGLRYPYILGKVDVVGIATKV
jgi:hypothetical protein